ncbi:MAG TPA: type II secretion system F family protein [Candidatus Saccharimonadales bacterium]|nr:type II secretion system F family protein [Candidatus Saccharimonadales bacterium]
MLVFNYEATNGQTGQKVKAKVQADDEQSAAKLIREQGLTPISIKIEKSGSSSRFKRIKSKDKVLFSRQLSTLINAGLPLVQSLRQVANQTTNKALKNVANQIVTDVEAGSSFSKSLEKYPQVFNKVYTSLVEAGEASGTLDASLERLANQQEKDADIISKVRGALIYPLIVLLVMGAVVTFMIVKVLPQVQGIYKSLNNISLPLLTRVLLGISYFVTHFWWIVIILIIIAVVFGSRWARTIGGKSIIDKTKMRAGPVGKLYMKMYMARFARTGNTLVASGVPLIQVLEICADAVDNVHIAKSLHKAIEKIKGGKSLSESLRGDPNFLELVPNMIKIGEDSGALETMLDKVADYFEKEVDNEIKSISTIIEPFLMVIMGIVALIIVGAILLPIYGLVNQPSFTSAI